MLKHFEFIIFLALGVVAGGLWYQFYVKPHDEARYAIWDCMGNDNSRQAYEDCVAMLRPND